jgi:hypothetical protein
MKRIPKGNLNRVEKAFKKISTDRKRPKQHKHEIIFEIDSTDGSLRIKDHVFLHQDKISKPVRSMLQRYDLILPQGIADSLGPKNFSVVNERASNIILSHIAYRLAYQKGWSSLTNQEIEFSVIALEDIRESADTTSADALASAIISLEIPEEIQRIDLKKYKEFRDAYSDVRKPFQELVFKLNHVYRLEGITSTEDFRNRIKDACSDFDSEVQKFRETRFSRQFKHWMPVGIGSLATLFSAIFAGPAVAIPCAGLTITLQAIEKKKSFEPLPTNNREVYQMIADMRRDIIKAAQVRSFL